MISTIINHYPHTKPRFAVRNCSVPETSSCCAVKAPAGLSCSQFCSVAAKRTACYYGRSPVRRRITTILGEFAQKWKKSRCRSNVYPGMHQVFWCFFERFSVSSGGKSLMFTVVGKPCAWLAESSWSLFTQGIYRLSQQPSGIFWTCLTILSICSCPRIFKL